MSFGGRRPTQGVWGIRPPVSRRQGMKKDSRKAVFFRALGGSTNHWTEQIECQIVASLDSFFSVTLLKHFCQSVSSYYGKDNINIVQYKYCFYLCEKDDV